MQFPEPLIVSTRCRSSDTPPSTSHLPDLITKAFVHTLLPHLTSPTLVVRQEMLALLQRCVTQLPASFPDLVTLSHEDPEADFFFNIAHIQLHRRSRALQRLATTIKAPSVRFKSILCCS